MEENNKSEELAPTLRKRISEAVVGLLNSSSKIVINLTIITSLIIIGYLEIYTDIPVLKMLFE